MFCNKCGNQLPEEAGFCDRCGNAIAAAVPQQVYPQQPYPQQPVYYQAAPPEPDVPNKGLNIASFFFPIIGFIIYATSNAQTPLKAKAALKMSIIGLCVSVGAVILFSVLGVVIPLIAEGIL